VLHAQDLAEAIRLRATRMVVWRRGLSVTSSPAPVAQLSLPGRPDQVGVLAPPRLESLY
jgi:hypothetical protein